MRTTIGASSTRNEVALALFGVSRNELLGRRIDEFSPPPLDFDVEASWNAFLQRGRQAGEFPVVRPDGSRRLVG